MKEQFTAFYQSKKAVQFDFKGAALSSDGGILLLQKLERKHRMIRGLASQLTDLRCPSRTQHAYEKQMVQRIISICAGYEDCNDATFLKNDPVLKVVLGGEPCSQPTLSRMENSIDRQTIWKCCHWWIDRFVSRLSSDRKEIVIDIDSTDDPTHGKQQYSLFHGYTYQFQYDQLFFLSMRMNPGSSPEMS